MAARQEDSAVLLGRIEVEDWRRILANDVRGEVLELASLGGWEPVQRLIESLRSLENEKARVCHRQSG